MKTLELILKMRFRVIAVKSVVVVVCDCCGEWLL